jgi:hypothetical protein
LYEITILIPLFFSLHNVLIQYKPLYDLKDSLFLKLLTLRY